MRNFTAVGTLGFNGEETKYPWLRTGTTGKKNPYQSMNFSVIAAKNNRVFVSIFGQKTKTIKTIDADKKQIIITWEDRFDPDVVNSVASYTRFVANLTGDDRKEFISSWDFIEYLKENKALLDTGRFIIRGRVRASLYNDKINLSFDVNSIFKADENIQNKIEVSMEYFYSADDIDLSDFKDEKKIYLNGYTSESIPLPDNVYETKYLPIQTVLNCSKLDENNEAHMNRRNFMFRLLGINNTDGKLSVGLKKKSVYKLGIVCAYNNGAEEVEFDESSLTPTQKMSIELGLNTIDDFKPKGQIFGNRSVTYNIKQFNLSKYPDGCENTEMTISEFESEVFSQGSDKKAETVADVEKKAASGESETYSDADIDDLFS